MKSGSCLPARRRSSQDAAHQVGDPAAGAVTPPVARDRQLREKETQGIDAALQIMIEGREIGL